MSRKFTSSAAKKSVVLFSKIGANLLSRHLECWFCSVVVITPDFELVRSKYSGNPSSNLGKTSLRLISFLDFANLVGGFFCPSVAD